MSFCSKCGAELQEDSAFCSKCGRPTGGTREKESLWTRDLSAGRVLKGLILALVLIFLLHLFTNIPRRAVCILTGGQWVTFLGAEGCFGAGWSETDESGI